MDYYRFSRILIKTSRRSSPLTEKLRLYSRFAHRHERAIFRQGAVNYLPKKFWQVAQIFTKQSKRNRSHTMQQHRPTYEAKLFLQMKLLLKIGAHKIR